MKVKPEMLPEGVHPTGDLGVYLVASRSRKRIALTHRVDLERLECDCESATMGDRSRARKRDGAKWENFCPHLKDALAAHGLLCAAVIKSEHHEP